MLAKIVVVLAVASLAAMAIWYLTESDDAVAVEREADRRMEALREHLMRR